MQRPLQTMLIFALAITAAAGDDLPQHSGSSGPAQQLRQMAAAIDELRNEVASLRRIVAELELDRHRENLRKLGAELATVRAEQATLADLERARRQDLDDLEKLLTGTELDAGQRLELETIRGEMTVQRGREMADSVDAARIRESELMRRFATEEQTVRRLDKAWKLSKGEKE
jgi:hypothetical protein